MVILTTKKQEHSQSKKRNGEKSDVGAVGEKNVQFVSIFSEQK